MGLVLGGGRTAGVSIQFYAELRTDTCRQIPEIRSPVARVLIGSFLPGSEYVWGPVFENSQLCPPRKNLGLRGTLNYHPKTKKPKKPTYNMVFGLKYLKIT